MYKHLKLAGVIADLLDNKFSVMGIRFGLDPILGLIPGLGDMLGFVFSLYLIWIGARIGLPDNQIARMVQNTVLDLVIGLFPVVGDIGDFVFKANTKNMEIIKRYAPANITF